MSKDGHLKSFLSTHEIVCLLETWTAQEDEYSSLLIDFHCFILRRHRKGSRGHHNGGVSVYIKSRLFKLCERINTSSSLGILLLLPGSVLSVNARILLVIVYLPPEGSPFYNDEINGILMLEAEIINILASLDGHI